MPLQKSRFTLVYFPIYTSPVETMTNLRTLFVICAIFKVINSAKILVWTPTPSISHQIIAYPVVKGLSSRGHDVTFITTNKINDPKGNFTEVDASFSYEKWGELNKGFSTSDYGIGQHLLMVEFEKKMLEIVGHQMEHPAVKAALLQRYDLFIVEGNIYPPLILLGQYYKCPVIILTSLSPGRVGLELIGDIINPSYETYMLLDYTAPRNFLEKLINTLYTLWEWNLYTNRINPRIKYFLKKNFGDKIKDYDKELIADLMLTNTHFVLNGVRPAYPNQVEIGGILKREAQTLPKDLQDFLDSAKEGVVYFSLGSNVKSNLLPDEKRQILINGFAKLPYKVLWKFENDTLAGKPDNVKIQKWLPQVDVLAHPNIKVFVTQGGIQSLEETIHARVPIVGIPFFGDQFWNIDHMTNLGIGVSLDKDSITADNFVAAIEEVARNDKYQKKVNEVGDLLEDSPIPPLEKAMYWIEYVIRHKGTKLSQSPKIGMSWFQYLCFDVLLFFLAVFVVLLSLTVYSIFVLYKFTKRIFATKKVKRS